MPRHLLPIVVLVALLAGFVPLKSSLDYGLGEWANDADYFYTIARSLSEGDGYRSNLSLYYQGFKELPHRVTTSPGWPVTLGAFGAVFGIDAVAYRLPNALYFFDLVLLYVLAQRLRRRIAPAGGGLFRDDAVVNLGHVAALALASNVVFFQFSSVPNNEPLAFALIFGALLLLDRTARKLRPIDALLTGLLAGLAVLTRIQALVLAAVAWGEARARRLVPVALCGVVLPLVPWVVYLASWMDPLSLGAVAGLDVQRETPELGQFEHAFFGNSVSRFLLDRVWGIGVAFDWRSEQSYVHHFGALAYAVPLGLLHLFWVLGRRWRPRSLALEPARALPVAALLTGVGMLLPVHAAQMTFVYDWLFGFRHGLPLVLLVVVALAYLDGHAGRAGRALALVLIVAAAVGNARGMHDLMNRDLKHGLKPGEKNLVQWLESREPLPAVVTLQPWKYGAFSRAGFHWTLCSHPPEQTLRLLRHAGADLVIYRRWERKCRFLEGLQGDELVKVISFANGMHVLALRDRVRMRHATGGAPAP